MDDVPADTDEYIYRPVTRLIANGDSGPVIETVYQQIWISQP